MAERQQRSDYDRIQDEQITRNAENIEKQTVFLQDIRNHFLPEHEASREARLRKATIQAATRVLLGFAFLCGLWELIGWYWDRHELHCVAERYADVAAELYYTEGNGEVALGFLNRAIEMEEANTRYRFLRAYIDGMDVVNTLLDLDRPLTKVEKDTAHQALGQALFLKGLNKKRAEAYILEGQVHLALGATERAKEQLLYAIELDPRSDFAHVRLASLYVKTGETSAAEKALERAVALNPASKYAWLWRGILCADEKADQQSARDAYEKALDIDPHFALAWYRLAWTWMNDEKKDYRQAREAMNRAVGLKPDYKEAYCAIGMFYALQKDYDSAEVYLDKALRIDGALLTALKWRGTIRCELGDRKGALA